MLRSSSEAGAKQPGTLLPLPSMSTALPRASYTRPLQNKPLQSAPPPSGCSRGPGVGRRAAPPRGRRWPRPPRTGLMTCTTSRCQPARAAPGPPPLSQFHTSYRRKDSTSQSSAGSMATIPFPVPQLPSRNRLGREQASREKWTRPAPTRRGVASRQEAGPRVACVQSPTRWAFARLGAGFPQQKRWKNDVESGTPGMSAPGRA